eukprot:TRINITY_DN5102_c0_g1_i1.p1 TRINITY_DN5102_c0_g1~~TRINITY_DN5102_c0_g1_i1.p1  ORF type:complete len:204 (+),score=100.95 TRINITY_DN5102_c0_g1_i1:126-737(+)
MDALKKAHEGKLAGMFAKHGTDADKPLAGGVIDALMAAYPSENGKTPPAYMSQFRTLCLNAAVVLPALKRGAVTPALLATLPAKEMKSELQKKQEAAIAEEEMEKDILTESYSARCGVCGLRKLSMSNANILTDLEESESWKKMEMEDDFCYCDALEEEEEEQGGAAPEGPAAPAAAKRPREEDEADAQQAASAKRQKVGSLM